MALPKTQKSILSLILKMENQLKYEKRKFGYYDDSRGIRYLIGPLYILLKDYKGALKEFKLFDKRFFDDSGFPEHIMMWALTLFKNGLLKEAENKLLEVMFLNIYLIPKLLDLKVEELEIYTFYSSESKDYVNFIKPEYFNAWDDDALLWAEIVYNSERAQNLKKKIIDTKKLIKNLSVGKKRNGLLNELEEIKFQLYTKSRQKKLLKEREENNI